MAWLSRYGYTCVELNVVFFGSALFRWIAPLAVLLLLSGCISTERAAPVESLSVSTNNKKLHQPLRQSLTGKKYRVKQGDTLYSIAFQAGQDYKKLAAINNINSPYTIFSGQWLQLKESTSKRPKKRNSSPQKDKKKTASKKWRKQVASPKKGEYSKNVTMQNRSSANSNSGGAKKISKWIWPSSGRVIATYSAAVQGNKGIDIAGHRGDDVLASAGGKVVYTGNALRGYGNLIIIKHNDDYLSAYAHNDKLLVTEKQWVERGQRIASMGSSGASSNRLHFEIRFRGKSVNPLKYLPKRAR